MSKPQDTDGGLAAIGVDLGQLAALVSHGELGGGGRTEAAPETSQGGGGIRVVVESRQDEPDVTVSVGPQFILKNASGKKVPVHYVPGEKFSKHSRDLVRAWTGYLLKLHQLCNQSGEFSVGFVFDEESEAECEQGVYGRVYYLNPTMGSRNKSTNGQRKTNGFKSVWQDRHQIIATACHEFVYGAYGLGEHNKDYAGKLTDVMGVAMQYLDQLVDMFRPMVRVPAIGEGHQARPLVRD